MLILTIRTDRLEAEIGLFDDNGRLAHETWQANRQLAETIHVKINGLLRSQEKELGDVRAIAVFTGPGSFTGLRIGISVANALADGLAVPIAGADGNSWVEQAIDCLRQGENDRLILPEYGASPRTTKPKH